MIIGLSIVNLVSAASLQDSFYSKLRNLEEDLTTGEVNDKAEFYLKGCDETS